MKGYNAFRFFLEALRAALYSFMRADAACRLASDSGFLAPRLTGGVVSFAGLVTLVCLDDAFTPEAVDGLVATVPAAARSDVAGAISMPNISERSSPASTLALGGPLRFFERSEPAFAIRSCRSTLRSVKSNSGFMIQSRADAVQHRRHMLAHRRPVRTATRE